MEKKAKKMIKQTEKWNRWMKEHIRLSLTLRTSLNYLKYHLLNGLLLMVLFGIIYLHIDVKGYQEQAEWILVNLEMSNNSEHEAEQLQVPNVYFSIEDGEKMSFSNVPNSFTEVTYLFRRAYIKLSNGVWKYYIREEQKFFYNATEYSITFYYDISDSMDRMFWFVRNAAIAYLVLMVFILIESSKGNKRIFRPVKEMTETARKLTVNNLHSERLQPQGTQNELRELAMVFNEMLDRLELSYESQKQFVSNASHELRTPIAVIQGYVRMLARWGSEDPEILKEAIEAIGSESKAMQDLVEKLLFLSRHDKKTMKLMKEWFSMGDVVEDILKEYKMVTQNRFIYSGTIQNVSVYGDPQLLKQALRVLIDNAIKYSCDGDSITVSCKEGRLGECILTIADTGIGMKKEDVDHIFDRFFRSDDVRDRKIEGHGLGLSIAKLIFLSHAGTIHVRTQYTKGTSFSIVLPKQRFAPRNAEKNKEGQRV